MKCARTAIHVPKQGMIRYSEKEDGIGGVPEPWSPAWSRDKPSTTPKPNKSLAHYRSNGTGSSTQPVLTSDTQHQTMV